MAKNNPNAKRTILVTGATGQQGGAVARHLRERGFTVRALVRDTDKPESRALMGNNIEVVRGDFDDRVSLVSALDGAYGVFSVQNPVDAGVEGEVRQGNAVSGAAQRAGVRHFVYSSVAGADQRTGLPFFESKVRIEEHLRGLGMPYTILRPAFFMENWLGMAGAIGSGTIALPLSPDRKLQQIAVDDIAGIATAAFEHPGRWQGRTVELAGDDLSMEQVAALFGQALGREVRYRQMPWEEFEQRAGRDYTRMYRWFEDVGYHVDIAALRAEYPRLASFTRWLERQDRGRFTAGAGAPARP